MRVQKIKLKHTHQLHWLVIAEDYLPIIPISNYLLFLRSIGKSPYTIRTYAYHLKIFWEYLQNNGLNWQYISIDNLAHFVGLLNGVINNNIIYSRTNAHKKICAYY